MSLPLYSRHASPLGGIETQAVVICFRLAPLFVPATGHTMKCPQQSTIRLLTVARGRVLPPYKIHKDASASN